ncbi:MAG: hypothetical protein WA491_00325, partial [Candidatus Acidiferrum sp.]
MFTCLHKSAGNAVLHKKSNACPKIAPEVRPSETTQLLGTLVVVYGLFMAPTGWALALMVWAYALVSFVVASAIKIGTYRLLEHRSVRDVRHL